MVKDVEERKVVGAFVVNRFVAIEEVSATEPIVVGRTFEGAYVIEDGIEVVSIEEEGREVWEDVEERKVVGIVVVGC